VALRVGQIDSDGITLHQVDVDLVAQLGGEAAAFYASAHHQTIKLVRDLAIALSHGHFSLHAVAAKRLNILPVETVHTQALSGVRHASRELENVASEVAHWEVAAVVVAGQRRLDRPHFIRGDGAARQAALGQHLADLARAVKALFVAVDVQEALSLQVRDVTRTKSTHARTMHGVHPLCLEPERFMAYRVR